jgi:hypothetical protein
MFDLRQDGIGGGGPDEGSRGFIVVLDELLDALDKRIQFGERSTADRLLSDDAELARKSHRCYRK